MCAFVFDSRLMVIDIGKLAHTPVYTGISSGYSESLVHVISLWVWSQESIVLIFQVWMNDTLMLPPHILNALHLELLQA